MEALAIIFFALAVSADGFIAGLAYGIKKIRIPFLSLIVIASASALAVSCSMVLGQGIAAILLPETAKRIGAFLLILMGIFFLTKALCDRLDNLPVSEDEPLVTLNLKSLGIVIKILKEPVAADMDASGEISQKEAFFLGLALAVDAMGVGIGIAMTGYNILFTALSVGVLKFILVNVGIGLGKIMKNESIRSIASFVPGLVFLLIGIMEFL